MEVLKILGFEGGTDQLSLDCLPYILHYAFTEEDIDNEIVTVININGRYRIYISRVENIIIDQLWKIVEGDDSNLYYALVRDMIENHENIIDFNSINCRHRHI